MNYGDIPYVVRGTETDYKKLFASNPDHALTMQVSIRKGFGVLPAGTIMAVNGSASEKGEFFPYMPAAVAAGQTGVTYLVSASGTTATDLYVTLDASYRFTTSDDLIIVDDTTGAEDLGLITAIDRTSYDHMAKVTVTTATGGTSFTVARLANIYTQQDSSTPWMKAIGILTKAVDTGSGENSKGAVAPVVLSNAILYKGLLTNYDSAVLSDLGSTIAFERGQFLFLR